MLRIFFVERLQKKTITDLNSRNYPLPSSATFVLFFGFIV
jgi:hypothetical protein